MLHLQRVFIALVFCRPLEAESSIIDAVAYGPKKVCEEKFKNSMTKGPYSGTPPQTSIHYP